MMMMMMMMMLMMMMWMWCQMFWAIRRELIHPNSFPFLFG